MTGANLTLRGGVELVGSGLLCLSRLARGPDFRLDSASMDFRLMSMARMIHFEDDLILLRNSTDFFAKIHCKRYVKSGTSVFSFLMSTAAVPVR